MKIVKDQPGPIRSILSDNPRFYLEESLKTLRTNASSITNHPIKPLRFEDPLSKHVNDRRRVRLVVLLDSACRSYIFLKTCDSPRLFKNFWNTDPNTSLLENFILKGKSKVIHNVHCY